MSTISPTDFDSLEIQQQYNDINNRWDLAAETDWDNENSSARLFERSRIKALAASPLSPRPPERTRIKRPVGSRRLSRAERSRHRKEPDGVTHTCSLAPFRTSGTGNTASASPPPPRPFLF
ncbi:hypothetical protein AAFF_G00322010 [Aldrovandia affinis]|uniref:Uncharacterized protein n=1 Tax=Aldrovandia affinis TaxID=143900 RepID=A0AAD7WQE9_9TELE|nr:hypothetical protein AAFF_G00322010 [Aldrovandia affinis]